MKKNLLFIITLMSICFVFDANAQYKPGIILGASSLGVVSDDFEFSSRFSAEFGSHLRYVIDDNSELFAEATLSLNKLEIIGHEFEENLDTGNSKAYEFKHTAVNIGAYYHYYLKQNIFGVFVGPTASYGIKTAFTNDFNNQDIRWGEQRIQDDRLIEEFTPFLYLTAGATVGINNIKARLKYSYGLGNPYKGVYSVDSELNATTSYIGLAVMYSIDFY